MNAARRKQIQVIEAKLSTLVDEIDLIQEAEQEAFDNLPEAIQSAAAGEKSETSIFALQSARDDLENISSTLEDARA